MSLVTETNQQYYQGAQPFLVSDAAGQSSFVTNFNTNLVFGSYDNTETNYALNNFKLYTSTPGLPGSFTEYTSQYEVNNNTIHIGTQAIPSLPDPKPQLQGGPTVPAALIAPPIRPGIACAESSAGLLRRERRRFQELASRRRQTGSLPQLDAQVAVHIP